DASCLIRSRQHAARRRQRLRVGAVSDRKGSPRPRGLRGAQPAVLRGIQGRVAGHPRVPGFPVETSVAPSARAARRLARGVHGREDPPHHHPEGARSGGEPQRGRACRRHRHQQLRDPPDRARVRNRAPHCDRTGGSRRRIHRPGARSARLPRGQGRAPEELARRARSGLERAYRDLVLQRLPERSAAALQRQSSGRGRPGRDAEGTRVRQRLARHQPALSYRGADPVETRTLLLLLLGLAVLVVAGSLAVGSVRLSAADLIAAFRGADLPATEIVWRLRAPRIAAAFCAGGLLAVAGVFLQALLRNPLADPYVFGVSGGAALGVLAAMAFGLPAVWGGGLGLAGALLVALLVAALAWRAADWSPYRLLLAGVVIAAGLNALIGLLLVLAPATTAKGMLFWLMGDLSYAEPPYPGTALLAGLVAIGVMLGQPMNALEIGRLKAASLGIEVRRLEI